MANIFSKKNKVEHADILAKYLPQGDAYEAKFIEGSNLRNFLIGLACELFRIEEKMNLISCDHDINQTIEFIDQWESAVGIPDDCLTGEGTLEERRQQVLLKLALMNAQTNEDFIRITELLGFENITIIPLQDNAYPIYPVPFFPTKSPESNFIAVVRGDNLEAGFPPHDVPFTPCGGFQSLLQCVLNKIKPANVKFIYINNA